jgi:hypothetical protein
MYINQKNSPTKLDALDNPCQSRYSSSAAVFTRIMHILKDSASKAPHQDPWNFY